MMLVSLLVVFMSLCAALVDCPAAPPLIFTDTDQITGSSVECDRCPPGTYLRARCTATRNSECAPCPSGLFTELWNYIGKCLRNRVCSHKQVEKTACSNCQLAYDRV